MMNTEGEEQVDSSWLYIASIYTNRKQEREFRSHFGLPSRAVGKLWDWIILEKLHKNFSGTHLLWTLYFLKVSPSSWSTLISFWNVKDERTFKHWLWYTLELIDRVLPDFNFEDRWDNWNHLVPSFLIDTTSVAIEEPYQYGWECHTAGHKGTHIKYQIVCAIGVPRVIDFIDPWPGAANDNTISESIKDKMVFGEVGIGDKGYRHDKYSWLVPRPGRKVQQDKNDKTFNYKIHAVRQTVERLIKRIKTFNVIKVQWRWSIDLHIKCFKVICKLVNLALAFEPLG